MDKTVHHATDAGALSEPDHWNLSMVLSASVRRHQAGDINVDESYRKILTDNPSHADALHLLGVVTMQKGKVDEARLWIARAITVSTDQPFYRNSFGEALREAGAIASAETEYRRSLVLNPSYPEAIANLIKVGSPVINRPSFLERFCRLRPGSTTDFVAIGDARLLANRLEDAKHAYCAALSLDPATTQAYVNIGAAAMKAKQYAQAAVAFRRALRLSGAHPGAWNNLASAAWEQNDATAATEFCRRSIALKPDHPDPYANLGYIQRSQAVDDFGFQDAAALCRRALNINPSHVSALNNLGIVHLDLAQLDEAQTMFRRTLKAEPNHPDARFNLSLALLKSGHLREAWEHYEARWETGQLPKVNANLRPWRGEPLNGATILLHAEQGHGDTLHFVRYAPLVAERGGRVVLAVQPALKRLISEMPGVAAVYGLTDSFPAPDFQCPLMSLPRLFGTELDTIPNRVPYLFPPAEAINQWLTQPFPGEGLRVGLVWSGDPRPGLLRANLTDRRRSMNLRDFAPLADVPNLRLVNLQMGEPAAQLSAPPLGLKIFDPMRMVRDFADTAALVLRLDLVITVDTSVAHLVGALGKPVWVLSRYDGCWRWLHSRDDSPWYPTMRLFRQNRSGDWGSVVKRVADELRGLAK